ncbi:MAG TPA: hypothetical protein VGP07_02435 [Polyangia bacterium]
MQLDSTKMLLALSLAVVTATAGCAKDEGDDFRDGVPQQTDVALLVPGNSSQSSALTASGGTTVIHSGLLGDQAEFYRFTRDITATINAGTVAVLTIVKTVTNYPPTSVAKDMAVWGPYTEPLSPNTWRLTVNRVEKGQFHYVLEGKAKTAADAAFVTVLSGNHTQADATAHRRDNVPDYGSGDFLVDWNASQTLPEHDKNVGTAAFTYSRTSPTSVVDIGVTFTQVKDDVTGMLIDAVYAYSATPGMGGAFDFKLTKDFITTTAALETMSVHSRWMETGAGRADTMISGGDLAATQATVNECWDSNFLSVYFTNSYGDPAKMWGAETSCAFTPAMYSAI